LFNAKGVNIRFLIFHVVFLLPVRCHLQTFIICKDAVPVENGMGLVAIQFENIRLVNGLRVGEVFPLVAGDVDHDFDAGGFTDSLKIIWLAGRIKGIANNIRAQFLQPDRQPRSP
jgi:hypothetical protein